VFRDRADFAAGVARMVEVAGVDHVGIGTDMEGLPSGAVYDDYADLPAVVAALAASYALTRTLPIMPVVTAVIVLIFGGLTLALHNDLFIKIKPTIIYALFGAVLCGGLAFDKPLLGVLFDTLFHLTEEGWRKLTLRWALFFFALAVLNEIVWRNVSTDTWVTFKAFGVIPLTFLFAALQYPLLRKYAAEPAAQDQARR